MPSLISQIADWGTTLPYWEQVALERIINGQDFTDVVYSELLQFLLEDANLSDRQSERPKLRLKDYVRSDDSSIAEKPILHQISNLQNINALVPNQRLEFGKKATVIFGDNGSGKSGYARVIASAAFTRGDKDISRNIKEPFDEASPRCADFYLRVGETISAPIHHIVGQPCPEMHSFYVFDSTSVRAHLTKSNQMSFSPANLDTLTKLAEVTDTVRQQLEVKIEQTRRKKINSLLFEGETEVSKEIQSLNATSNEGKISSLGHLTENEINKIDQIDLQIAELKVQDFDKQIKTVNQNYLDLQNLISSLEVVEKKLNDSMQLEITQTMRTWQENHTISAAMSRESFNSSRLLQVGSPVWYDFAMAALKLAESESRRDMYPQQGDVCLLCSQPISENAHNRLHKLWNSLRDQTHNNMSRMEAALSVSQKSISQTDFYFFRPNSTIYRYLKDKHVDVFNRVEKFIELCKKRQSQLVRIIDRKSLTDIDEMPTSCIADLGKVIGYLEYEKQTLEERKKGVDAEIKQLSAELKLLEHRKILSTVLVEVLEFIKAEKWIQQASSARVKGSTTHITKKFNALFSELVTDKYIELFTATLKNLKCPLDIDIAYKAEKGKTYKQLVLKTNENFPRDKANPDKILSEGEQRAVALADFFTEIALDEHSSGFILDDPVTSLDFRWKENIAENIIRQAVNKQAIIFTHDLHFLHCLKTMADEHNVDLRAHWIQKRNALPGYVFIDNSPMTEKDFKVAKKAKEFYDKAMKEDITAEDQQFYLDAGFGALRTSYEAFIMYELFNGVVLRFEERISGDRLKKIYIDDAVRNDVAESMGRISRYIGAHLHSDMHAAQKPEPELLNVELAHFEQLRLMHKQIKKEHGIID